MSARKPSRKPKDARPPAAAPKTAIDLDDLAGQLSDALAFMEVAVRALDVEEGRCGAELLVLEHGISELKRVHAALDRAGGAA